MADIGNQLEGVEGGLERFLDALDSASVKLGSNAALESRIAREEFKRLDQEKRFKMKIEKMEKTRLKQITESVKNMKLFNKSIGDMGKGMLKSMGGLAKAGAKAGAIGGLVIAVKFLIDGLFKIDNAMAALSKRTSMTRSELKSVGEAATNVSLDLTKWGVSLEQAYAEAGNLVEQFGSAHWVSEQLITDSLALQKGYGLAAEQAGALTEALERTGRAGEAFRDSVEAISGKVGVSASLVMRDLASRAQQIAIQSERGTEALARMSAKAIQAGTSLQDWSGIKTAFSDVGNIQDTLAKAQRIFGDEFINIVGTAEELARLNVKGAKGREEIMNRIQKGIKATTQDLGKQGIRIQSTGRYLEDMELHVEGIANGLGGTLEAFVGMARAVPQASREFQALNDKIMSGKSLIEIMKDGVMGIAGGLSTTFSDALGLASDDPDGPRAQTEAFIDWVTDKFQLKDLGAATKGKGAAVYFEKLFDIVGDMFGKALAKGISWVGENYAWDWSSMGFRQTEQSMRKDYGGARAEEEAAAADRSSSYDRTKELQHELDWMLDEDDPEGVRRKELLESLEKEDKLRQNLNRTISGLIKQQYKLADAAEDAGHGVIEIERLGAARTRASSVRRPARDALGSIRYGRSAIVGEAGGEVVISRSALRSGIGVGGRAASALAGIGVPGFQNGGVVRSTRGAMNRTGEQGAFGSQSYRTSGALAVQKEVVHQQAAMIEYWRQHYEHKMDDLIDERAKKEKKGPPWLKMAFREYNKELAFVLNKNLPKEMSAGVMAGLTSWSQGGDLQAAMTAGAKAGITAGLSDEKSGLYKLTEEFKAFGGTLRAGLAAFAQGGNVGRSMVQTGSQALAGMIGGGTASKTAAQYLGMGTMGGGMPGMPSARQGSHMALRSAIGMDQAAKGKYVNSPTLMMVGEEGRGEVVVPTERIRKGLPINAGVAKELGSIGVPGFQGGGVLDAFRRGQGQSDYASQAWGAGGGMSGYAQKTGYRLGKMGGFGGMGRAGAAGGLMTFGNVFAQTGDWKRAGTAGVGAGLGVGAGMALGAMGIPPPLSGMLGNAVGGIATKGLNKVFNLTGGYGKGRRRSVKLIEDHIKSGGRFDHGSPSGLSKWMNQAIGGYEKTPTEANFQKLTEKLGTSSLISSMGIPAPHLIALGTGQTSGGAATKMYSSINRSLYGAGGDKYRKALAIPSLAAGGIVNRPTTALIGEAGPEAVVPLGNSEMMQELKKQNKLMAEMIKTQKETGTPEIRMDGKLVSEVVGKNFYETGLGM